MACFTGSQSFFNGFLGDRANARFFMATGLLLSALTNLIFGSTRLAIVMESSGCSTAGFRGWDFRRARGCCRTGSRRKNW